MTCSSSPPSRCPPSTSSSLKLPTFPDLSDLPGPDLSRAAHVEQLAGAARDAAYIGVGLVVMTVERFQTAAGQLQAFGEEVGTKISELVSTGAEQAREAFSAN